MQHFTNIFLWAILSLMRLVQCRISMIVDLNSTFIHIYPSESSIPTEQIIYDTKNAQRKISQDFFDSSDYSDENTNDDTIEPDKQSTSTSTSLTTFEIKSNQLKSSAKCPVMELSFLIISVFITIKSNK